MPADVKPALTDETETTEVAGDAEVAEEGRPDGEPASSAPNSAIGASGNKLLRSSSTIEHCNWSEMALRKWSGCTRTFNSCMSNISLRTCESVRTKRRIRYINSKPKIKHTKNRTTELPHPPRRLPRKAPVWGTDTY